ncbi:MAG: hypothetical protein HC905_26440, partial [Bacteroidales bacterium]|nr:hypothetical protein [Bacteroidales bacterium]
AVITDVPTDGFSLPYQYSLALGFVLYSFIGLWFFRKILLEYFSDKLTAIILVIIVLGTNFLQYATVKNLEQTNALFNLLAIITWFTIKWHKKQKLRYLIFISLSCSLMVLVKPSEIFCYLIPLLWGVFNRSSLQEKIRLLVQNKKQLILQHLQD